MVSLCSVKSLLEKLAAAQKEGKISPINITVIQRSVFLISGIKSIDQDVLDIINELT